MRTSSMLRSGSIVGALLVALAGPSAPAAAVTPGGVAASAEQVVGLVEPVGASPVARRAVRPGAVRRSRQVRMADVPGAVRSGTRVRFDLFRGTSLRGRVELVERQLGRRVWVGSLDRGRGSFAVVRDRRGAHVEIDTPRADYEIVQARGAMHRLVERRPETVEADRAGVRPPEHTRQRTRERTEGARDSAPTTLRTVGDGARPLHLAVAYTPQALRAAGSHTRIRRMISAAVGRTNAAYQRSGIRTRLRLVGMKRTGSREIRRNLMANLTAAWKRDGRYDDLPRWRNRLYADLVHLVVRTHEPGSVGRGYLNPSHRYAYSVSARAYTSRHLALGHEIGHNLGADHDGASNPTAPRPARGRAAVAARWYTVMASATRCVARGVRCRRIGYFSNPHVLHDGVRTGGRGMHNTRVINANALKVANFRQSRIHRGSPVLDKPLLLLPGTTLAVDPRPSTWLPGGLTFRYQWYVGDRADPGATGRTFTVPLGVRDVGRPVKVRVTTTKAYYPPVAAWRAAGLISLG